MLFDCRMICKDVHNSRQIMKFLFFWMSCSLHVVYNIEMDYTKGRSTGAQCQMVTVGQKNFAPTSISTSLIREKMWKMIVNM